jgi:hypothetical protein
MVTGRRLRDVGSSYDVQSDLNLPGVVRVAIGDLHASP